MRGEKNVYVCEDGHETVTLDRDEGTTPFMMRCRHDGCTKTSQSKFYRVDQRLVATWEWYKPAADDPCMRDDAVREHVELGGLMPRKITSPRKVVEQHFNEWLKTEDGQKALSFFEQGTDERTSLKLRLAVCFSTGVGIGLKLAHEAMQRAIDHNCGDQP